MPTTVHARVLQRAAELLGGREKLRAYLGASRLELQAWLAGEEQAPLDVFLRAVDVVSSRPMSATQRRDTILSYPATATPPAPRSLLSFLQEDFAPERGKEMLEAALDTAIAGTAARMGNIQLACADGLRIGAQRGFDQPFLEFFALVDDESSACGKAMKQGRRVVVPDVASETLFAGTEEGEVLRHAGVRAVVSTPLLASSAWLLGVLSTHYDEPHHPAEDELQVIDRVAQRVAAWLEGRA